MRRKILDVIAFISIIVFAWYLLYFIGVEKLGIWKSYMMPSPSGVLDVFIFQFQTGNLFIALLTSLKRILIGFLMATICGFIFGLLMSKYKVLSRMFKPIALGVQTLPSVCWIPFAILWFGLSETEIIFVIVLGATFSICLSVENAIANVNKLYIKVAKTMGIGNIAMYTKVIIPASLPMLVGGIKQGWSFAWRALMSAEMMSASVGLGQILVAGRDNADVNQIMFVMILIVAIGIIVEKCIFSVLEHYIQSKRGNM